MVNNVVLEARDSQQYYLALKTNRIAMGHEVAEALEFFAVKAGSTLLSGVQSRQALQAAGQAAIDALGK